MTSTTATATGRQARESIVREHIDAENRHDPDGVVATFSSSRASYDIPALGQAGQRGDGGSVREMWTDVLRAFADFRIEPGPMFQGDDHIFVEVRMSGRQQSEFAGIRSAGRSFATRVGCLYEFEDDELVCERVYFDFADVRRQLDPTA